MKETVSGFFLNTVYYTEALYSVYSCRDAKLPVLSFLFLYTVKNAVVYVNHSLSGSYFVQKRQ